VWLLQVAGLRYETEPEAHFWIAVGQSNPYGYYACMPVAARVECPAEGHSLAFASPLSQGNLNTTGEGLTYLTKDRTVGTGLPEGVLHGAALSTAAAKGQHVLQARDMQVSGGRAAAY
jgi:hypothetical protein